MDWRKSSFSSSNGGACVEVAGDRAAVYVRDTTDRDGMTLQFTTTAWQEFTGRLRG